MFNLVSLIIGFVALVLAVVAFIPLLGWANWLIIPLAVIGLVSETQAQSDGKKAADGDRAVAAARTDANSVMPVAPVGAIPPWFSKAPPLPPPKGGGYPAQ